jgi:hypothetical protein
MPRPSLLGLLALALALGALAAPCGTRARAEPRSQPARDPRLRITGARLLPERLLRSAAAPAGADGSWSGAEQRIVELYRRRGFEYARAWRRIERSGAVRVHVDEGAMRVVFVGVGSVQAVLLRIDLNLPHNVFHAASVASALEELRRKHDLLNIYYRVKQSDQAEITPLGDAVRQRVLQIYIVTREFTGWGLSVDLSATWGILPTVTFSRGGLAFRDDLFRASVALAFPFRRYLFDEDPKFQWVHGGVELGYRLPRVLRRRLAPRADVSTFVSHLDRVDLGLRSYYVSRTIGLASLSYFVSKPLVLSLGGGVDVARPFAVELASVARLDFVDAERPDARGLLRLSAALEQRSDVQRRDWLRSAQLGVEVALARPGSWMIRSEALGQYFYGRGRHRLLARWRGILLAGDVRLWDEVALASDYQRVFFGNAYWVHEALQLETAYRIGIWSDWIDLGVFHDLSLFVDRTREAQPVALADAFGPSLHLVLFDLFALDLYLGFGFSPRGFDHTLSFSVQTIF